MEEQQIRSVARAISIGRVALGVGALLTPGLAQRVLRLPDEHDSPTTRVFARLFGGREIGVGLLSLRALDEGANLRGLLTVNASMDAIDTAIFTRSVVAGEGINRAAIPAAALALPVALLWLSMLRSLDA